MFTSGMAESRQKTVVLQGLDADLFGEILSYIYSGNLHVSLDKVQPLYQAADLLQLDYVRDTCSSYMAMNVERSTCVDLYKFADVFSVESELKRCLQCIYRHFKKVASSDEFCSLSVNQLTEIISHDELDVKEETTVWEAVVRWVQHSREDRLHHLPSILPHIRFKLLTSDDMAAILDHPLVREDPGRSAIRNVVKEASNMNKRPGMDTLEMAMIFMETTNGTGHEILYMNPRAGKYIRCRYSEEDLPSINPITAASGNNIYIGTEEPKGTDQLAVLEYNHAADVWQRASMSTFQRPDDMSEKFEFHEFLVEVDKILYYLFAEKGEISTTVWIRKYDRHTNQWQECSQLKLMVRLSPADSCTAVSCGPHIYFLIDAEMHRYDPSQDCWCKPTPPKFQVCTAVSMGTEIFCTDREFSKTMVYDTESDRWQERQGWLDPDPDPGNFYDDPLPYFFVLDNQLHVWFEALKLNTASKQSDNLVYVYDRSTDTWRDLEASMPIGKYLTPDSHLPVACMYLPCLTAKGTDLSTGCL
ncbi:kelch repeat and BTB domain-containing protein 8-like [Branchiostoma floridae x Branchiostoma japonicum]